MRKGRSDSTAQVVFYQLCTKFVDNEREIPKEAEDVMYYTLAVGHHTGIIDCFSEKLRCSKDVYRNIVEMFPTGSDARYKLDGINRHGEIQVDKTHLAVLDPAVKEVLASIDASDDTHGEEYAWLEGFSLSLDTIKRQPGVYLMGREREV